MRYKHYSSRKLVVLASQYSRLEFKIDSRDVVLNGVQVSLGHAVGMWKGNPILADTDFRLTLDPVLRYQSLPMSTVKRIVIDPGHGGKDPGTHGRVLKNEEKDLVLLLAKRLRTELLRRGYEVYLTRDGDQALTLDERPATAGRLRADLFISLHANYVATTTVRGVESFRLCPKGAMSTYGNSVNGKSRTGNACDRRNMRLAYEIQKAMMAGTGAPDRGVKQASFAVLRDAPCPAALIEVGYMSHSAEERLLASSGYQAKIAASIANGVDQYRRAVGHQP
jgi:N-acetylmuramoyl-L-alanine amidase